MLELTPEQREITTAPLDQQIFLSGPAASGKTTSGVERLRFLLQRGVSGSCILVLTPQRTLQEPYLDLLRSPERAAGGEVVSSTVGGLARRMVDLFWPLVVETAGFALPDQPPVFLTLETAQYHMAHIVRPLLEQGYFESLTIDRNRLYSQLLDNLNKSAAIGFPQAEIGARLDAAYYGDSAQRRVYRDAQDCTDRFRQYCLAHNLLDFSLQLEIFWNILWPQPIVRQTLSRTARHLIYDNVEEDIPRAHDLIRDWLPDFDSALLIYDEAGGFRRFLGADVVTGFSLGQLCDRQVVFERSFVSSNAIAGLGNRLSRAIAPEFASSFVTASGSGIEALDNALFILQSHFYPELLEAVAAEAAVLIEGGLPPSEIVILAPYLSDALRFSITNRLQAHSLPWRTHRPSRSLHDEPASHALLTLSALAHPQWEIRPPHFDLAYTLVQSIAGFDLVRAQLLAENVYKVKDLSLSSFDGLPPGDQERITFVFGNRYATLREWILRYRAGESLPLDHFLRSLFGELLSQPGFGFHSDLDSVRVAASLVESVRKFRQALETADGPNAGREYVSMLNDGVIAAQYLEGWQTEEKDAILVAPAHTFLMMNHPVSVQFWLDPGSSGWYERLSQPLTHPYVLSRNWERQDPGRVWSDADEVSTSRAALANLTYGLLRRCRERLYLAVSELGESGFEPRGDLLKAFQQVLQEQGTDR